MKAIIHIGSHKTGTTTIQRFLFRNRHRLKKQNVFITSTNWGMAHHSGLRAATCIPEIRRSFPFSVAGDLVRRGIFLKKITAKYQEEQRQKIRRMIEKKCCPSKLGQEGLVVFSDETLSTFAEEETEHVRKLMSSLFDDVAVVLYLRRQPEYLVSYYYTLVASGCTMSFDDYVNMPEERSFLAYRKTVERWSVFGKNNVKVRLFDRQAFHENDLLSDFAHAAGFDISGLDRVENENVSSLDSASIEFLRLLNKYCPKTDTPTSPSVDRSVLKRVFKNALEKQEKAYHLSQKEAQKILDTHREGNNWIAREYLGKERLFHEDVSMYPEEIASPHGLNVERCAEITASLWRESGRASFLLERMIRNFWRNCLRLFSRKTTAGNEQEDFR